MRLEAFILCFNESKMIEHTLNYYSKICDKITIIDNQSTDDSIAIVRKKFPDVIIEELNTNGEFREDIQINIRNNIWKQSNADFVIMADMDEFIVDEDIFSKLNIMKELNIAIPKVKGYNMFSENFPTNYKELIFDQVTNGFRDQTFDKNIIFNPKLVKDMNFGPGSHMCKPVYKDGYEVNVNHHIELKLLHFKYLGREYLYKKHSLYANRMSEVNKKHNYGFEYELGNNHIDKVFNTLNKQLNNQ